MKHEEKDIEKLLDLSEEMIKENTPKRNPFKNIIYLWLITFLLGMILALSSCSKRYTYYKPNMLRKENTTVCPTYYTYKPIKRSYHKKLKKWERKRIN